MYLFRVIGWFLEQQKEIKKNSFLLFITIIYMLYVENSRNQLVVSPSSDWGCILVRREEVGVYGACENFVLHQQAS